MYLRFAHFILFFQICREIGFIILDTNNSKTKPMQLGGDSQL